MNTNNSDITNIINSVIENVTQYECLLTLQQLPRDMENSNVPTHFYNDNRNSIEYINTFYQLVSYQTSDSTLENELQRQQTTLWYVLTHLAKQFPLSCMCDDCIENNMVSPNEHLDGETDGLLLSLVQLNARIVLTDMQRYIADEHVKQRIATHVWRTIYIYEHVIKDVATIKALYKHLVNLPR